MVDWDIMTRAILLTALAIGGMIFVMLRIAKHREAAGKVVKKRWPQIVEVKYMGPVGTEVKTGGFTGAMVGGFLFGDAGAVVGGMAPKETKILTRFAVKYDNGRVKIEDCYSNSDRFGELMSYVKWEDL